MSVRVWPLFLLGALILTPTGATAQQQPAPRGMQIRDALLKLTPQGQQIFGDEWLRAERQTALQRGAALRAADAAVFAAMSAEPFNPAALARAYSDQRVIIEANQKSRHDHLVNVLTKLSPADRRTLVDHLRALRLRNTEGKTGVTP